MARWKARLAAVAPAALAVIALAAWLGSPWRTPLDAPAYDLLSTIAPPAPASDIVVVAIDEPSFAEIGLQWPWPRSLHAELIEAVRAAGAKAIGLDVVFAEPSSPEADDALAAAAGPDTVLAADQTVIDMAQGRQTIRVDPLPKLLARGASQGVVAVTLERDGVLRRFPPFAEGFAETVARKAGAALAARPERALVRFRGGPRTYATVSYYQALDPKTFLPPDALRGKIVLIGLSTQSAADAGAGGADVFATPFTAETGRLTAGVEAHATMIDALRAGDLVRPAPLWAEVLALSVAALGGLALGRRRAATWTMTAGAAAGAIGLVGLSWLALQHANFWLSPAAPALALLFVVGADAAIDYARERRARRDIARAFGQYLSPDLVERLAQDPSALKLGGELRTLTILFCDVRGFTTLAERMKDDPERLTSLVNRLLGPLSDAVLAERGTIDKYIGDCVMAFWNAPLDAPDHAERAVAAGLRMLDAVAGLNAELAAEAENDVPPLSFAVGIGINTGACVVGNLGSARRFDYTAIGDAVNLASRLEGASRFYGTPLLIGPETAAGASDRFGLVELDRIAVKGRAGGLAVFTALPAIDGALSEAGVAQAEFLKAYRDCDWPAAEAALDALRAAEPRLALYAQRMAERMDRLKAAPPPPSWDGVFAATDK